MKTCSHERRTIKHLEWSKINLGNWRMVLRVTFALSIRCHKFCHFLQMICIFLIYLFSNNRIPESIRTVTNRETSQTAAKKAKTCAQFISDNVSQFERHCSDSFEIGSITVFSGYLVVLKCGDIVLAATRSVCIVAHDALHVMKWDKNLCLAAKCFVATANPAQMNGDWCVLSHYLQCFPSCVISNFFFYPFWIFVIADLIWLSRKEGNKICLQ